MNDALSKRLLRHGRWLPALVFVAGCATPPASETEPAEPVMETPRVEVKVNETAMLPLLGYLQLLPRLSASELARERKTLAALPQTPSVCLRTAMLLGQARTPANLPRAQNLLAAILKSNEADANSLHPLARLLATHYSERQRLEQQNARLTAQVGEAEERLNDSQRLNDELQRRNDELQRKIDALADIERSLSKLPAASDVPQKNAQ
ncbi:MAG: permease [Propionivibrio sp.]